MKTGRHLKIAGALHIVQSLPLLLISTYYITNVIQHYRDEGLNLFPEAITMLLLLSIFFLFGSVFTWFGFSLSRQRPWTMKTFGFICCALSMLTFPHVIGIYTLVILIQAKETAGAP